MTLIEFEDMTGNPVSVNPERVIFAHRDTQAIGIVQLVVGFLPQGPMALGVKGSYKEVMERLEGNNNVHPGVN